MNVIILLIILFIIIVCSTCENFIRDIPILKNNYGNLFPNFNYEYDNPKIPLLNGYTNFPWWNTQHETRKGMSYDLRGDPYVIPQKKYIWNNYENR